PDEARRAGHAEEAQLPLEVVADGGAAVVVPDGQTRGNPRVEAAEVLAHALAERFQRLEAAARQRGMDPDALAGQFPFHFRFGGDSAYLIGLNRGTITEPVWHDQ